MTTPPESDAEQVREEQAPGSWLLELDVFEGPLDLLLHLVRRHELDILDIPIAFICEKYLEYLEFLRALDLEVAGDYLVMAATLAYLKSRELLPSQPEEEGEEETEDGPDPREELIQRLLEYQKYRAAAEEMNRLPVSGRDVFARGHEIDIAPADPGLAPVTLFRLAEAFNRVLENARIHRSHEVVLERVSVSERMRQLCMVLEGRERVDFEQLFLDRVWSSEHQLRAMLVVTLMSILELVKLGIASVHQPEDSTALLIERSTDTASMQDALSTYNLRAGDAPEAEPAHDAPPVSGGDTDDHG